MISFFSVMIYVTSIIAIVVTLVFYISGVDDMCAAIETVPVIYMSKLEM